jgi:hypothetical protein
MGAANHHPLNTRVRDTEDLRQGEDLKVLAVLGDGLDAGIRNIDALEEWGVGGSVCYACGEGLVKDWLRVVL